MNSIANFKITFVARVDATTVQLRYSDDRRSGTFAWAWTRGQARVAKICAVSDQQIKPGDLADWILRDQLPVRLQIQLHKYLWGDVRGR